MSQRVIAGAYLIVLLVLGASSYCGWQLLGAHDRQAMACWVIVGLVWVARYVPRVRRID